MRRVLTILAYILIIILIFSLIINRQDINTLTNEQFYIALLEIDDIGPTLAQRCVEYRQRKGSIKADELIEVNGIGPKRLESLKKKFK